MSNFTPLVEKEYEFDGDTVKVLFSRMLRKDMLTVLPTFLKLSKAEEGTDEFNLLINDVLNTLVDILPGSIKSLEGLTDSKGEPISIETVTSEMYFMQLTVMIAMDLIKESGVPGGKD